MRDFVKKLKNDPSRLEVLGDGKQRKSYMHIEDCLDAIFLVANEKRTALQSKHNYQVYHLGNQEYIEVSQSARIIIAQMGLTAEIEYTGGRQGWVGDNPFVFLDVRKMQSEGWTPKNNIKDSVRETVDWINDNEWVMENRQ